MAYESRQSSRRTSKRPRSYGTEDIPAASLIPFPSGKKSFFSELVKFHTDKGTALPRFPTISGVFVDLFELYCAVVNRGGYNRATSFDCWKEIAEAIGLSHCTNLTVGLRQIYARYLAHYESLTIALDDDDFHDFDDLHMDPGSNSILRKKTMPTITVSNIPVPMTYNQDQQNKHAKSNTRSNAVQLCGHSYLDKVYLGLLSGFPNEQKFLVDTCMLLSFEPAHAHAICGHHHLLNALLAQVGVLPDDSTFISLYRDWFRKVSNCSFIQFWIDSVKSDLVKSYILRNDVFRDHLVERSLNKNESSHFAIFDCNCNEYRKVALTLYLLRHLSFESRNQDALSENKAVKEILLMCIGNKFAKLRVLALDTIANMSSYLNLSQDCLNDLMFKTILSLLNSPDSIERIRSMEILGGMSQMQSRALVIEKLQVSVYEQIVAMLTVQDLLVLLSCVGLLYQLTYTGPEACECLIKVQFVVEQLTALITFDVQSMGLEALTSVKVIEQPKSILGRTHQSSSSTYNAGLGIDLERPIVKWLLGTYDLITEESVGVFSNDVLRDFKKSTVCSSLKASHVSLVSFNRWLKSAFPAAPVKVIDSLDGSIFLTGVCKRGTAAKYPKNIPSSAQGRASNNPVKGSVGSAAVNNLPGGMMNHTNKPFPIKPQASYATTKPTSHTKKFQETPKFSSVESSSKNAMAAPANRAIIATKVSVDAKYNNNNVTTSSINPIHVGQQFANKGQNVLPAVSAVPVQVNSSGNSVCNNNNGGAPVPPQQQQQQQPILVQLMLPGSGESAFKKPTEANKGPMIVNEITKSKANHQPSTPALFVGSVSGNQLIFSAVQGNSPAPQQTSLIKAVMKPVNDGTNSATSANNAPPPSIVLGPEAANTLAHTRAIPTVIHQPPVGRNSNSSSKTINATQGGATLMCNSTVITNSSLAAASFQGAQNTQQSHNATIVPNVVKPKPISNSVAPPITTNMHGKHPNITSYMNGNCNISKTVNGDYYISEVSNSSLPSSPASNFDNNVKPPAPPVNIATAAATKSGNGSTAYQNGLINSAGNIVNNKCEIVNGVAYKIVNNECIKSNIPSITPSNDSQQPQQQKILYAVPQQNLATVKSQPPPATSAPHLVVNGEANEPILDIESIKTLVSRAQVDIKQTLDHAANCVIANNVMTDNGGINATSVVPIVTNSNKSRKRRSSNEPEVQVTAANGHNNGQIFVTPINNTNSGGNGLSGFKKVKVNDMSSSSRLPPVARDNESVSANGVVTSNLQQQQQQNSPSVSKKESYSCIPSLHAAVNSVIAASADGKLVTGNNQLSLVPSSTSSNTTKVIIQPVSVGPSSPHTFRTNIPQQPAPLVASANPASAQVANANPKRIVQPFVPAVVQPQAQTARSATKMETTAITTVASEPPPPQQQQPEVAPTVAVDQNPETEDDKSSVAQMNSHLVYKCEWDNCTSRFEKWQQVFHHCCRAHCNMGPDGAEVCKWKSCDGLRRKKFSLFTHLQEKHCSETLLEKARQSAAANTASSNSATAAGKPPGAPSTSSNSTAASSTNPESLYSMHTLHFALQRSGWVPPSKDTSLSVIEKEGPVSKAVRLNAALVLRNLAQHSPEGRRLIRLQERKLILAATSCIEASPFLASCLLNLCNL